MSRPVAAHPLLSSLLLLTLAAAAASAPAVAAELEPGSRATLVFVGGPDSEPERIPLGDRLGELAPGETEEIVTDSGRLLRLTRTEGGVDLEIDGKTTSIHLFGSALGGSDDHAFHWTPATDANAADEEEAERVEIERTADLEKEEREVAANRHSRVVVQRHGADGEGFAYAFVFGDEDEEEALAKAERLLTAGPRVMVFAGEDGEVVRVLERRETTDVSVTEENADDETGASGEPRRVHKVIVIERAKPKAETDDEDPR